MARAHFDITGDNSNIVSVIQDTEKKMEELSKVMNDLGKSFDVSTPEKQMKALQTAIKGNERVIKDYERQLRELGKAQREAALAGETNRAAKLGLDMQTAATRMQQTITETNTLKSALNELNGSATKTEGIMVKLMGGTENFNKIIAGLPPGLRMIITEVNGLKNTFNALLATPIAPFLAALAVGYASVHTWLTKAADGQRTFAYLTGYTSGLVSELTDRVIQLGRDLYDAFDKSFPVIKRIGEVISGLFKVIVGAGKMYNGMLYKLGYNLTHLKKADWSQFFTTGLTKEGAEQAISGIELITGESESAFGKRAKQMADLNRQEHDLSVERKKWLIEEAKLDERIADARVRMMSSTEAGRASAAKELKDLNDRKYDKQIEFAERELRIVKEKNKLHENSQEDLNREYELEARIYQLKAQKTSGSGRAERIMSSVGRQEQRQEEQLQNELNQILQSNLEKRIALMDEGGRKAVAQINAAYDRQMEAVRKQREKWTRMSKEMGTGGVLTAQQTAALAAAEALAESTKQKALYDRAAKNRQEYLKNYGTFQEKYRVLVEQQTREMAAANLGDPNEVALIGKKYEKAFRDLENSYSAVHALIFADAGQLSDTLLAKAIKATEAEIKRAKNDNDIQALTQLYQRLREQLSEQAGRNGLFDGVVTGFKALKKAREEIKNAATPEDLAKGLGDQEAALGVIMAKAKEASGWLEKMSGAMRSFNSKGLNAVADAFGALAENVEGVVSAFSNYGKDVDASMRKGAIATALATTFDLITMIGTAVANNREAQKEWNRTLEQGAHKLAMLDLASLDYKRSNMFGVENPYKKAIDGAVQYGAAVEALQGNLSKLAEGQVQVGQKKALDWKAIGQGFMKGAGAGAAVGGVAGGGVFSLVGAGLGAAIGGVVGAAAGAFSTKTEPIFASLASKYGELVNDNYELNPQLLADYDKLDEDTKQIIDNWEEIRQKAEEAEEQMRDNFSDIAGDMGKNLSDALVNAFRNGNLYSAVDDFHSYMTKTIENILSQLVFSSTFEGLFKDLEADMMASFKKGGDQDITDDLIKFEKKYPELLEAYGDAMASVQESMQRLGFDVFTDTGKENGASQGSFSGMSQQMGASLEGRFTAVQIAAETIAERVLANAAIMTAMSNYMAGSNTTLSEIRDAHIREVGYLEDIARQTRPLNELVGMGDKLTTIANKL